MKAAVKNTGVTLAVRVEVADTFWKRLKGEMFRKKPSAMLLKGGSLHVHTCFMRFPIDLLFLREGRVLKLVHKMKPWRFCRAPRGCDGLLELPAGTLAKCKVKMGDEIVFVGGKEIFTPAEFYRARGLVV
jgi:uncharacterized membrane protein (UPF0127 family)